MADTKITRLRNLLTPFRNYFALLEEQENEPSLVMQDKIQVYLDAEKERIFKMQAEVWDIIAEIPNEACEGNNVDLKNANCAIFDVSVSVCPVCNTEHNGNSKHCNDCINEYYDSLVNER